jgi:hypothetical protein
MMGLEIIIGIVVAAVVVIGASTVMARRFCGQQHGRGPIVGGGRSSPYTAIALRELAGPIDRAHRGGVEGGDHGTDFGLTLTEIPVCVAITADTRVAGPVVEVAAFPTGPSGTAPVTTPRSDPRRGYQQPYTSPTSGHANPSRSQQQSSPQSQPQHAQHPSLPSYSSVVSASPDGAVSGSGGARSIYGRDRVAGFSSPHAVDASTESASIEFGLEGGLGHGDDPEPSERKPRYTD